MAGVVVYVAVGGWASLAEGAEVAWSLSWAPRVLYGLAILSGVWTVLPEALASARRLRPDMNLLTTVAVAGAVAIGERFEGAAVAFLFAVAVALEAWSVGRARRPVVALVSLTPPTVRLLKVPCRGGSPVRAGGCRVAVRSTTR